MENRKHRIPSNPLTKTIMKRVEFVALQMVGTAGFNNHDREDIQQTLYRDVIAAFDSFNPERASYSTFAYKVIRSSRAQIYRDRIARGDDMGSISLSALDEDVFARHEEDHAEDSVSRAVLHSEIRELVASLPKREKDVCELLMDGYSIREAIALSNVPNSVFYRQLLPGLRNIFSDFFQKSGSTF